MLKVGTLSEARVRAVYKAARQAEELEVPIVLDPVGAGVMPYRNNRATTSSLGTFAKASLMVILIASPPGR